MTARRTWLLTVKAPDGSLEEYPRDPIDEVPEEEPPQEPREEDDRAYYARQSDWW